MTHNRIKAFTDGIRPRRTLKDIADRLLNERIGIHEELMSSADNTLNEQSTFVDFIRAQKLDEMFLLVESDKRHANPQYHNFLDAVLNELGRIRETGRSIMYNDPQFNKYFTGLDNRRPLRVLVNVILPKLSDGVVLSNEEKQQIKSSIRMLDHIKDVREEQEKAIEGQKYHVHDMQALHIAMGTSTVLRLLKETISELKSLDSMLSPEPERSGR